MLCNLRQRYLVLLLVRRIIICHDRPNQQGLPQKEHAAPVRKRTTIVLSCCLTFVFSPDKNPDVKGIHERFARLGVIAAILRDSEGRKRCVNAL